MSQPRKSCLSKESCTHVEKDPFLLSVQIGERALCSGLCFSKWSMLNCFSKTCQPVLKHNAIKLEVLLGKVRQTSLMRNRVSSFSPALFATQVLWLVQDLLSQQSGRIWNGKG